MNDELNNNLDLKSKRIMKLEANIKKALSTIIVSDLKEIFSEYMNLSLFSITHVQINDSMDNIKIGFIYPKEYEKGVLYLLNDIYNKRIKSILAKKIMFRRVPKITFLYDNYHDIRNS